MKRTQKIFSLVMSALTVLNYPLSVLAYDIDENGNSLENISYQNTNDDDFTNSVNVLAQLKSIYSVTIPKTIVLSGTTKDAKYCVKAEGDIAGYETLYIIPDDNFYLHSVNKNAILSSVSQDKIGWKYNDFDIDANGLIEADNITAGKWTGTFNFNIFLDSENDFDIEKISMPENLDGNLSLLFSKIAKRAGIYDEEGNLLTSFARLRSTYNINFEDDSLSHILNEKYPTASAISFPDNISVIGDAIKGTKIKNVYIPENIDSINDGAFDDTKVETLVLPQGVSYNTDTDIDLYTNKNGKIIPLRTIVLEKEDIEDPDYVLILEKGYMYQVLALYNFKDDVTNKSTIRCKDSSIVKFIPNCFVEALEIGETDITGTYYNKNVIIKTKVLNHDGYEEEMSSKTQAVSASGYTGIFDDNYHSIAVSADIDATIYYSSDGKNYDLQNPSYKDAGTYTTYFKVKKKGFKTFEGSETVEIEKAENTIILGTNQGATSANKYILTSILENKAGSELTVTSSNPKIATAYISENTLVINGVSSGSCDLILTSSETNNYKETSIEYPVVISNTVLNINANGGLYNGSSDITTFGVDEGKAYSKSFGFTGKVEEFTVPYTGFYFVEAWGARGGDNDAPGGYGGYVKTYSFLNKGEKLYVGVGGQGHTARGLGGGFNGGANAGGANKYGAPLDYSCTGASGGGGGATQITTKNLGAELINYINDKDEVLVVAGGGSGGSASSIGEGGTVLYAYTENNKTFPGEVINGASTNRLNGRFALGTYPGDSADGGGGGGGWVGGKSGLDTAGHPAGGGASFVNTTKGCIPIELVPNSNKGNGKVSISYEQRSVKIDDPVREGYKFDGWQIDGSGTCAYNKLGKVTMFTFVTGTTTTLKAKWIKL